MFTQPHLVLLGSALSQKSNMFDVFDEIFLYVYVTLKLKHMDLNQGCSRGQNLRDQDRDIGGRNRDRGHLN